MGASSAEIVPRSCPKAARPAPRPSATTAVDVLEEQQMEVEAIESIYVMGEFNLTGERPSGGPLSFTLDLRPHEEGMGEVNHVAARLTVVYNDTYPETQADSMTVSGLDGLTTSQVAELQGVVDAAQEENVGIACVFSVAEGVKEWLADNNHPPSDGSMRGQMLDRQRKEALAAAKAEAEAAAAKAAAAEVAARRAAQEARFTGDGEGGLPGAAVAAPFVDYSDTSGDVLGGKVDTSHGTMVTVDTFMEWRAAFEAEQGIDREAEEAAREAAITGRKWFQANSKGVAVAAAAAAAEAADRVTAAAASGEGGEEDDDDYGAAAAEAEAERAGPIDASVFAGEEDEDLSDLSDLSDGEGEGEEEEEESDDEDFGVGAGFE